MVILIVLTDEKEDFYMASVNVSLQVIPCVPDSQVYPVVDKVIDLISKAESSTSWTDGNHHGGRTGCSLEIVKKAQEICILEGASRVCP